jgi:hypothetical protein
VTRPFETGSAEPGVREADGERVERPIAQGPSLPPHVGAAIREGVDIEVFIDKPARDLGFG